MVSTNNRTNAFVYTNSCWYTTKYPSYGPEDEVYILYTRFHGSNFIAVDGLGRKVTNPDHKAADGIFLHNFSDTVLKVLVEQMEPCEQTENKEVYVITGGAGDEVVIVKETLPTGEVKFSVER